MIVSTEQNDASGVGLNGAGIPRWKRPLDLLLLFLLLPAILACFVAVAILIKLVSRGPVFFTQERVGYRGRRFRLLKFRSMHPQADTGVHRAHVADLLKSDQPMKKLDGDGDKRLIPFGRELRASGLDELPQLINVLKGDMSIIGPRPCTTYEYELYEDWQKERLNALPGLTGLWQVSGKNRTTFTQMIELDIEYARKASIWLDLEIVARTFPTLAGQVVEHASKTRPDTRLEPKVTASFRVEQSEV
jgi:lipopolysaccharide/colanic/teichoic acid biosynthesis glycosyltransferase